MAMDIKLNKILTLTPDEYCNWTICLNNAPWEGIYSFEENKDRLMEHISWKRTYDKNISFRNINTKYCLQFIRLDKDLAWDNWLFLGAFENTGIITTDRGDLRYDLKPIDRFSEFKDKLVIYYKKHPGDKQAKIVIDKVESLDVVKILEKPYIQTSRPFEGYNKVSLSFKELKVIINSNIDNWRELLTNVQCIYVISDKNTGKLYVGSTYGYDGVWQRWSCYVDTNGHGEDKELIKLIDIDPDYAVKYFQFTIIEPFFNVDGHMQFIRDREIYWKKVLLTKDFGYNDNY